MGATYYPYLPQEAIKLNNHDAQRILINSAVNQNLTGSIGFFVFNPRGFDNDTPGQGNAVEYHGIFHAANSLNNAAPNKGPNDTDRLL